MTNTITPYMENWLEEIEKDIATGKNVVGPFRSCLEMDKFLRSIFKNSYLNKVVDPLS